MYEFQICDVFTDRPLAGNQLAVFPDGGAVPEELLAPLAMEIHFSETVYLYPPAADGTARIRIFTPGGEIPFAGHPTLGSATIVARQRGLDRVVLETGKGPVPVRVELADEHSASGWMEQPIPVVTPFDDPRLLPALGVERSQLPVELYELGIQHLFVMLADERAVADLRPDFGALSDLGRVGINCFAGSGRRYKTRMFGPEFGVMEDPATGSAAGPLCAHLVRHGLVAPGEQIEIAQGAELGRPSRLLARVAGSRERIERVEVGGSAVVVGHGAFRADLLGER